MKIITMLRVLEIPFQEQGLGDVCMILCLCSDK